jgi:hypothetical protein
MPEYEEYLTKYNKLSKSEKKTTNYRINLNSEENNDSLVESELEKIKLLNDKINQKKKKPSVEEINVNIGDINTDITNFITALTDQKSLPSSCRNLKMNEKELIVPNSGIAHGGYKQTGGVTFKHILSSKDTERILCRIKLLKTINPKIEGYVKIGFLKTNIEETNFYDEIFKNILECNLDYDKLGNILYEAGIYHHLAVNINDPKVKDTILKIYSFGKIDIIDDFLCLNAYKKKNLDEILTSNYAHEAEETFAYVLPLDLSEYIKKKLNPNKDKGFFVYLITEYDSSYQPGYSKDLEKVREKIPKEEIINNRKLIIGKLLETIKKVKEELKEGYRFIHCDLHSQNYLVKYEKGYTIPILKYKLKEQEENIKIKLYDFDFSILKKNNDNAEEFLNLIKITKAYKVYHMTLYMPCLVGKVQQDTQAYEDITPEQQIEFFFDFFDVHDIYNIMNRNLKYFNMIELDENPFTKDTSEGYQNFFLGEESLLLKDFNVLMMAFNVYRFKHIFYPLHNNKENINVFYSPEAYTDETLLCSKRPEDKRDLIKYLKEELKNYILETTGKLGNYVFKLNNMFNEGITKGYDMLDYAKGSKVHAVLISVFLLIIISFCKCANKTKKECNYYPCFYINQSNKLEIHNKTLYENIFPKSNNSRNNELTTTNLTNLIEEIYIPNMPAEFEKTATDSQQSFKRSQSLPIKFDI